MRKVLLIVGGVIIICIGLGIFTFEQIFKNIEEPIEAIQVPVEEGVKRTIEEGTEEIVSLLDTMPAVTVIAENLTIPWDMVFLPEDELLVSERDGTIARINTRTGSVAEIGVPSVSHQGEGGLLGIVSDPDFKNNQYLYLYRTSTLKDSTNGSVNEVVRYTLSNDSLIDQKIIVGNIPGSLFHNGGRIAFGPDGLLYITTGDARNEQSSQDLDSLGGKILRVNKDGTVPNDNPFKTAVYSYGHRNPQGLTWDNKGHLWSTEHGRTTATLTGMDELNLIVRGENYGWPQSEGDTVQAGTVAPKIHSGPSITWAPGSATYYDGSIFFGGLRGERLYEAVLNDTETEVTELRGHFIGEYGRIRTTLIGPDGALYIMTSNRDGRGDVREGDDTIIRLNPRQFRE